MQKPRAFIILLAVVMVAMVVSPTTLGLASPTSPVASATAAPTYRVGPGDTLIGIGRKVDIDWRNIASWNKIVSPYPLVVGQVLRLTSPDGLTGFKYSIHPVTAAELPYSYRAGCPIAPAQLRRISMYYVGFDKHSHKGQLIVAAWVAEQVVVVFNRLYNGRFPIQRMKLVDAYQAKDASSMAANNTSAFNCRLVSGTDKWSQHSYGTAIDINPVRNPSVNGNSVQPPAGVNYLDRSKYRLGMVMRGGIVEQAFDLAGWGWGGDWSGSKDYQHFSSSGG